MPSTQFSVDQGTVVALTIEETLLLDWAKELFTKSVTVALEYCKNMSAASVAAIPLYYGLFAFIVPDDWIASSLGMKVFVAVPALLFLIASAVFAIGALPRGTELNLDKLTNATGDTSGQSVEAIRGKVLDNIRTKAWLGTGLFALGIVVSAFVVANVAFDSSRPGDDTQRAIVVSESSGVVCGKLASGDGPGSVIIQPKDSSEIIVLGDATEVHIVKKCP